MVSWDKMTCHKKLGDIGIHISRFQNVALLGKLVWDILNSEDKLWVRMFKDIYLGENLVLNVLVERGLLLGTLLSKLLSSLKMGFNSNWGMVTLVFGIALG